MFSTTAKGRYGAKKEEREVRTLLKGNREGRTRGDSERLKMCGKGKLICPAAERGEGDQSRNMEREEAVRPQAKLHGLGSLYRYVKP